MSIISFWCYDEDTRSCHDRIGSAPAGPLPYTLMGIGGSCGSVLHFWIKTAVSMLPGTLLVNMFASVLMGIFMYESIATGRRPRGCSYQ